jgi:hypothetical protein
VLVPILIFVCVLLALLWFRRQGELFRIETEQGKPTVVHGYVPAALLNDFGSAVRQVGRGTIRAHKLRRHR